MTQHCTSPHRAIAAKMGRTQAMWVETSPPQECPENGVICRTLQLGVCGTDREIIQSAEPAVPEGEDFLILGHECLARVEAVGNQANGADGTHLAVGDFVVPSVRRTPGGHSPRPDMLPPTAYLERGISGQHGFSQALWTDDPHYLLRIPPELVDLAVFVEPQSVAEKAMNEAALVQRGRLGAETWTSKPPRVLITGMGPIGFAGAVAAWSRGWSATIYGRDPEDSPRAQLARQLGAEYRRQQAADLASLPESERFDLILECTGVDEVLMAASHALAHCGAMVWLGAGRTSEARSHNLDDLMRRTLMGNQVHLGSVNSAPRDFNDALTHLMQLQREVPIAARGLITRRAPLEQALEHFSQREQGSIKTVFMLEDG